MLIGHVVATFLVQAGFHAFTSLLPVELARLGVGTAEIGVVMGVGRFTQVPAALAVAALGHRVGPLAVMAASSAACSRRPIPSVARSRCSS